MQIQFTDGTTTLTFAYVTTGHLLRRYTPQTPDFEHVTSESSLYDGGEQPISSYRNVTETVDVAWTGTLSQQRAAVQSLTRLFQQARQRQRTHLGAVVRVQLTPETGEGAYESEVLSGRILIDDSYRTGLQIEAGQLLSQIVFTRRYYWEGALTSVPLSNGNGENVTYLGLAVYNCTDDGGEYSQRQNYADIQGSDIEGDLPAPLMLTMENTYNSERDTSWVWIAGNVRSNPFTLYHVIEAEDASGGSSEVSGTSSGGAYRKFNTALDTQVAIFDWGIPGATLTACAGNWFQLMWRSEIDLRGIWFEWELHDGPVTVWRSGEFQVEGTVAVALRATGAVRLPPWLTAHGGSPGLSLRLYGRKTGGFFCNIDFLQLWALDYYAVLFGASGSVPYGDFLVYDGIEEELYVDSALGNAGTFTAYGGPLLVEPGRDQRLYFLQHANAADVAEVDRSMAVSAWYRPRRLSL